jgi:hypothetical protein
MRNPPSSSSVLRPVNGHVWRNAHPVVAGKDDDRVPGQAVHIERLEDAADLQIHALDHSLVGLLRAAVVIHQTSSGDDPLRLRLVAWSFPGPMRRVEMNADQKWLSDFA